MCDGDGRAAEIIATGFPRPRWECCPWVPVGRGGLAKPSQRGGLIDRFHRRLLWPIRDLSGDVVGFGARRLFDDDKVEAKYLNTPETPIYKKSQLLYGVDVAKKEIARQHRAVIVEGYTDVMACHLAGVTTAIASCGTAFSQTKFTTSARTNAPSITTFTVVCWGRCSCPSCTKACGQSLPRT